MEVNINKIEIWGSIAMTWKQRTNPVVSTELRTELVRKLIQLQRI